MPSAEPIGEAAVAQAPNPWLVPVLKRAEQRILLVLVLLWSVGTGLYWAWWLQPGHWVGVFGMVLNTSVLFYVTTLIPMWSYWFLLRMQRFNPYIPISPDLCVAMVVTKAPSEPWPLVRQTLEAMLRQDLPHDTWLADEDPADDVIRWCICKGVKISTRKDVIGYHNADWPRRRRCKEGNLAYFYDHYGYQLYDIVVQLDADHCPAPGYLEAMVRPFADPHVGYVAAPSICDRNASGSWVARGRLHAEANLHGPLQLGSNGGWAPLCFGSHYAVRTVALAQIGGLGPELAEDHSTTLLMNSHRWSGVFAQDAKCHGLGPETFEDAMVQEFQWSRSLTTILLSLTPRCLPALKAKLALQFVFSQLFYPLRGLLTLAGLLLPAFAMAIGQPWVRVSYPLFLLLATGQMLLTLMPAAWLGLLGLRNPPGSPVFSWELVLYELGRGPWVLAGVIAACLDCLRRQGLDFKVTSKLSSSHPLRLRFVSPHLGFSLIGTGAAMLLSQGAGEAKGYMLLLWISALSSGFAGLVVVLLDLYHKHLPLRRHIRQLLLPCSVIMLSLAFAVIRYHELSLPLHASGAVFSAHAWRP
jgi:cellulose synthase (UDP-forming)